MKMEDFILIRDYLITLIMQQMNFTTNKTLRGKEYAKEVKMKNSKFLSLFMAGNEMHKTVSLCPAWAKLYFQNDQWAQIVPKDQNA